ncbi:MULTISPECIES: SHOCT domain-containing protein [Amycolatopsis]|uniref:Putative oligomerization/nucleic acid binding protein n=1 Tax=Amycolatopsis thermoflava TaxID=84480 RepID=A0A3N2H148_9PSEU|nr:SHOCT domain-containing protein [Amycolatopsis thermoflava]ROS42636.1 putative oligomerization/nucleic acid binding protein [Amycolatopsis thermoflava]
MPGLLRGIARTAIVAGTAKGVANRVTRRQEGRWARQDAERAAETAPPAPSQTDVLSQLRELGQLRDQGVLTEAEFQSQKARLLG